MPTTRRGSSGLYELHADMCKVFSNEMRLRILHALRGSEKSVADIAEVLKVPLGTVSPHLLMMKRRHVLVSRKAGTQVFYRIANPKILDAFDLIQRILCERMEEEAAMARRGRP
ncbi:MAG TPA: metalloregulator ArsR/SmtB family transcription factor [Bdellovibrionota bacterium]|nr:metalloregulator ArsR/SmtB family transcription factor [Bdellovibrionota bacterium]